MMTKHNYDWNNRIMKREYIKRLSKEAREKLMAEVWIYNLI